MSTFSDIGTYVGTKLKHLSDLLDGLEGRATALEEAENEDVPEIVRTLSANTQLRGNYFIVPFHNTTEYSVNKVSIVQRFYYYNIWRVGSANTPTPIDVLVYADYIYFKWSSDSYITNGVGVGLYNVTDNLETKLYLAKGAFSLKYTDSNNSKWYLFEEEEKYYP
jgi:hypothetical protein